MAFIAEWVENFIRSGMEDPRERDAKFAAMVRVRVHVPDTPPLV